jgi:uncharacterized membrane protein YhaH (DUF805 family)
MGEGGANKERSKGKTGDGRIVGCAPRAQRRCRLADPFRRYFRGGHEDLPYTNIQRGRKTMTDNANRFQPPTAELDLAHSTAKPDLRAIYTSYQGRISRKVFWIYGVLLMMVAAMVVFGIVGAVYAASKPLGAILGIPAYIAFIWVSFAIQVKRWHDRDKSGWWVLIGFIPVIGSIWALVETGFLRGTVGPNRFGADLTDQY